MRITVLMCLLASSLALGGGSVIDVGSERQLFLDRELPSEGV